MSGLPVVLAVAGMGSSGDPDSYDSWRISTSTSTSALTPRGCCWVSLWGGLEGDTYECLRSGLMDELDEAEAARARWASSSWCTATLKRRQKAGSRTDMAMFRSFVWNGMDGRENVEEAPCAGARVLEGAQVLRRV